MANILCLGEDTTRFPLVEVLKRHRYGDSVVHHPTLTKVNEVLNKHQPALVIILDLQVDQEFVRNVIGYLQRANPPRKVLIVSRFSYGSEVQLWGVPQLPINSSFTVEEFLRKVNEVLYYP